MNEHDPDFPESTPAPAGPSAADIARMVNDGIASTMAPLFKTAEAVSLFGNDAAEINGFLAQNPDKLAEFQRAVASSPTAAADYARYHWQTARGAAANAAADAADARVADARAAALADAGVVGSGALGGGGGRTSVNSNEAHEEKLEKLLKRANETGDATAFMREKFFGGPEPMIEMWLPGEAPPPGMMRKRYKNLEEVV